MSPPRPGGPAAPTVHLVGAGPGDPELLTLRAARLLACATLVVHDRLVPGEVLALAAPGARVVPLDGTAPGRRALLMELAREARAGGTAVRLKGGDPLLFAHAVEEMEVLAAEGVAVAITPGISAAFAAAAEAGVPLTRRGQVRGLLLATAQDGDGRLPAWPVDGRTAIAVYMGLATLPLWAARLRGRGLPPDLPVSAVFRAGRPDRRTLHSTLERVVADVARSGEPGPVVFLVGCEPVRPPVAAGSTGKERA